MKVLVPEVWAKWPGGKEVAADTGGSQVVVGGGTRQTPGALGRVGLGGKKYQKGERPGANKNPWKERQGVRKRTHPQAGQERPKKELRAR